MFKSYFTLIESVFFMAYSGHSHLIHALKRSVIILFRVIDPSAINLVLKHKVAAIVDDIIDIPNPIKDS